MGVKEFVVATMLKDDQYIMKWIIGSDSQSDPKKIAEFLDNQLLAKNKNYKVARSKALQEVEVELVPQHKIYSWSEDNKKLGGQVKIPRVMKEKDFLEFEQYIKLLP